MTKLEPIYVGDPKNLPKTTSLGWCRVTVGLVKALDKFCEKNDERSRSAVVRKAIRVYIGATSIEEILEQEKPFFPRKEERNEV